MSFHHFILLYRIDKCFVMAQLSPLWKHKNVVKTLGVKNKQTEPNRLQLPLYQGIQIILASPFTTGRWNLHLHWAQGKKQTKRILFKMLEYVFKNWSHKKLHVYHTNKQPSLRDTITYRLVAVSLIVEHGRSLGSIAPGLHGPQPHLVLWETLQHIIV